jgi:hypothetical protein
LDMTDMAAVDAAAAAVFNCDAYAKYFSVLFSSHPPHPV